MRINYYEFPDSMTDHERFVAGAANISGSCRLSLNGSSCKGCPVYEEIRKTEMFDFHLCEHFHSDQSEWKLNGVKASFAKEMLKKYGGTAYTYYCGKDGVFEVTEIKLKGTVQNRH